MSNKKFLEIILGGAIFSFCFFEGRRVLKKILKDEEIEEMLSRLEDCEEKLGDCEEKIEDCEEKLEDWGKKIEVCEERLFTMKR